MSKTVMRGLSDEKGVLEDVLQFAPQVAYLRFPQAAQVNALAVVVEDDFPIRRLYQANDRPPRRGLAASGFAHQTEGFPAIQRQVDPIHGFDIAHDSSPNAFFDRKMGFELRHFEKGLRVCFFHDVLSKK